MDYTLRLLPGAEYCCPGHAPGRPNCAACKRQARRVAKIRQVFLEGAAPPEVGWPGRREKFKPQETYIHMPRTRYLQARGVAVEFYVLGYDTLSAWRRDAKEYPDPPPGCVETVERRWRAACGCCGRRVGTGQSHDFSRNILETEIEDDPITEACGGHEQALVHSLEENHEHSVSC